MNDSSKIEFDELFRNALGEHMAEPPVDSWNSVSEGLFYSEFSDKLSYYEGETPFGTWPVIRAAIDVPPVPRFGSLSAAAAAIIIMVATALWAMGLNFDQVRIFAEQEYLPAGESPDPYTSLRYPLAEYSRHSLVSFRAAEDDLAEVISTEADLPIFIVEDSKEERLISKSVFTTWSGRSVEKVRDQRFGVFSPLQRGEGKGLPSYNYATGGELAEVKLSSRENKWTLASNYSPVYSFRHIESKSLEAASDFYYEKEFPLLSFSTGISAEYKVKKRLSIRSGIQYSKGGIQVNDVVFYRNMETGRLLSSGIVHMDVPYEIENSLGEISSNGLEHYITDYVTSKGEMRTGGKGLSTRPEYEMYEKMNTNVIQDLEYLEVPVMLNYRLVDRRLGLNLLSGLGAGMLIGNNVYMDYQGEMVPIGYTNGLSKLNLVGTLGLGLEYMISDNFSFNMEPSIKYFLNSMNQLAGTNTHPYYLGVFSGLSISF